MQLLSRRSASGGGSGEATSGEPRSQRDGGRDAGRLGAMEYRSDPQGLRAVAVLLVALDHAGVGFLKGGYVGVDVFFVLSGFLITGLLLAGVGKRGYVSLVDFYARRARRILPAAALTLIATTVAANYLLNYVRAQQVAWDSFWAALFAANIHFAPSISRIRGPITLHRDSRRPRFSTIGRSRWRSSSTSSGRLSSP